MRMTLIWIAAVTAVLVGVIAAYVAYQANVTNPRVIQTVINDPQGPTARRVMLLTFPDRTVLPVNYLREGTRIYVGADGRWWRTFRNGNVPVQVFVRGESLPGLATAVLDDPSMTEEIFARLRPDVPDWLPDWANGILIVIDILDP